MEKWQIIKENQSYEISNHGNFRNVSGKVLKINKNARGYYYCNISTNGKVSKIKIHRLVAKYFVNNPEKKRYS